MAKYLVTGAAGFIGSSMVRALLERGDDVCGIDNLETGRRENLEGLGERLSFRVGSVLEADLLRDACRGVEVVFHEAAVASVPASINDPVHCNDVNVTGTLNVLLAARDAGVRRVVFAASCAAYGDNPNLPLREDETPAPFSPYAVSKLAAEQYMSSFYRVYGLETVSLRYFNIFGPRQDPASPYSGVLAIFISKMLRRERPTIFGDGEQSRDFTFIDNCVQANLLAASAPGERCAGRVFNIGAGGQVTLNRVYRELAEITGFRAEPAYAETRTGDIRHSYADITAAGDVLGYKPTVSFEEGLRRTVEWYRANP